MGIYTIYHIPAPLTNLHLVLDLDQTLIATQDLFDDLKKLQIPSDPKLLEILTRTYHIVIEDLERPGIGTKYNFWGVIRPHVHEFLLFAVAYFKTVSIWSAGKRLYVEPITDHLFKDLPQPHIIFSHDDILMSPDRHVLKPLTKMLPAVPGMTLENVMILDDNVMTFSGNTGNGVLIPPYEPPLTIEGLKQDDHALLQFKQWLLKPEVIACKDIRTIDKSKIFTTPINK